MKNCNNIEEGETELIMSRLYWICTKFVKDKNAAEDSSKAFKAHKGEQIVNQALDILK